MPFTSAELANIANSALDFYLNKGKTEKQNIQDKPMMQAFEENAGPDFPGGKGNVSVGVKGGQGGGSFAGYTHDDQVTYYNPASNLRVNYPWKEHHIGLGLTHTELKIDGITVIEDGGEQETREKEGREVQALANLFDSKLEDFDEDKKKSWDHLLHADGTADPKALAGIQSIILDNPAVGTTGGLSRVTYPWWRNRAATAAAAAAGGMDAITSSAAGGGTLLQFLQGEDRQIKRFAQGGVKLRRFAGSDFIGAMEKEIRANGNYSLSGFRAAGTTDGKMADVSWDGKAIIYDPTLDDMGLSKRMYTIDMRRIRLMYMAGEKNKKASPPRPYDRYVMYRGLTSTAVLVAQQLNTSAVYDIK